MLNSNGIGLESRRNIHFLNGNIGCSVKPVRDRPLPETMRRSDDGHWEGKDSLDESAPHDGKRNVLRAHDHIIL